MLTGFNTDVEHDGVVYHVQTEDKGLDNPIILSLVYTGGAILATKRAPYDDLIASGFDEGILAKRLQRQHKLICAAIHSGRVEDLKRMGERAPAEKETRSKRPRAPSVAGERRGSSETPQERGAAKEIGRVAPDKFSLSEAPDTESPLRIALIDEKELRAGELVSLRVRVSRAAGAVETPASGARVVLKTLGTSFRPASTFSITDQDGMALIFASLPPFDAGRAAILLRAESDGQTAELRRIVLP